MSRDKQIKNEHYEIAEIISQSFDHNGEKWDASDFEWSAYQVQMAGYRKTSDVAREIFEEIENKKIFLKDHAGNIGIVVMLKDIAELKKKYTDCYVDRQIAEHPEFDIDEW